MEKLGHLQPIETHHNGYVFRSRLEARWAVFWDALGVTYDYEPEGVLLEDGTKYLPDFWLPDIKLWVEIKPVYPDQSERRKAQGLAVGSGQNVLVLYGRPGIPRSDGYSHTMSDYWGLVFVGNPQVDYGHPDGAYRMESLVDHLRRNGYEAPDFDYTMDTAYKLIEMDCDYYRKAHKREHPHWENGWHYDKVLWIDDASGLMLNWGDVLLYEQNITPRIMGAYDAAKSARFGT